MNYIFPKLLDMLAADYVVGTLRGAARLRFERLCLSNSGARAARDRWEDRLTPFALQLSPLWPRGQVWPLIRDRISPKQASFKPRFALRLYLPLATAAVLVAVWVAPKILAPISTQVIAVLRVDATHPQWRIERSVDARQMKVVTLATLVANSHKTFELWVLPQHGKSQVSLGLLPQSGALVRTLSERQSAAIIGAGKLTVRVEPLGGSPTGAPTGPVTIVGAVANS